MTDGELEFREEIKRVIRRHDPDPDDLRELANSLEDLADRHEATDKVL